MLRVCDGDVISLESSVVASEASIDFSLLHFGEIRSLSPITRQQMSLLVLMRVVRIPIHPVLSYSVFACLHSARAKEAADLIVSQIPACSGNVVGRQTLGVNAANRKGSAETLFLTLCSLFGLHISASRHVSGIWRCSCRRVSGWIRRRSCAETTQIGEGSVLLALRKHPSVAYPAPWCGCRRAASNARFGKHESDSGFTPS
ncbi:hypothetical protein MAPG_11722 [Magnaporthiopsis poae ATCC 64411]|uniref:Uncharacterized protein n=1 Tax=Magnaporthiopsis poae (strain ATCC 64411 / 73-15) TaxID=644358 RepID=A0A0C4EG10_MAGP6|nr:hypothetical protein MAPG_11722 [Magnaporthiopsis poae ATCC 64411]